MSQRLTLMHKFAVLDAWLACSRQFRGSQAITGDKTVVLLFNYTGSGLVLLRFTHRSAEARSHYEYISVLSLRIARTGLKFARPRSAVHGTQVLMRQAGPALLVIHSRARSCREAVRPSSSFVRRNAQCLVNIRARLSAWRSSQVGERRKSNGA